MKKTFYILGALLAAACAKEQPYEPALLEGEAEDGAKVTIEFSLAPETKGMMAHNPDISTLHVAVFNAAGVLKEFQEASLTNPDQVANGKETSSAKYSVELTMAASTRILHFIADSPVADYKALVELAGTTGEANVIGALASTGGAAAYWQRIEVEKIDAYTYQGGVYRGSDGSTHGSDGATSYTYYDNTLREDVTVYKGDYIKRNGYKVLDATGYFASAELSAELAYIPLIRNFAEITVSATSDGNFTPKKFALVNVPKGGYVAPYDVNEAAFATVYTSATTSLTHSAVSGSNYVGTLYGSVDTSMPATFIDLTDDDAVKQAYMYERPVPNTSQPATSILVGGIYTATGALKDDDGLTWFKIEISDEDGTYFPIYRGVSYNIQIGTISGSNGYASAEDAYNKPAIGDISNSVETKTLEQISDGKGTTLWVEYIDYVGTQSEDKTLYYTMYYQPTAGGAITYLTSGVKLEVSHPDASYPAITQGTITGAQTSDTGTPDDTKTWYKATVPLGFDAQNTLKSVLTVKGKSHADKEMSREVNYRVISTLAFKNGTDVVTATSLEDEEAGQETTLTIVLPNDLGFSMFPLVLKIEAQNGNFTTVDGLPVESGPSLFDSSKNAFYFLKTINYTDYYNALTGVTTYKFTSTFKTTRVGTTSAAGTNATTFAVLDKVQDSRGRTKPYFEQATCDVTVGGPVFKFRENALSVKADVTSATLSVVSTDAENPEWTLTASDNVTSLSQESGTGNATVTVSFPANTSETEAVTYTVTGSREGFDDVVFTITQAKVTTAYYKINLNAGTITTNKYAWTSSTVNPDSNSYYSYQSDGNYHIASSIATMSVTVCGYTEFTVYVRSYAESTYDYVVVRNLDGAMLSSWNAWSSDQTTGSKANTRENQQSGTALTNYTQVTFTSSDGLTQDDTEHTFYIQYGKDSSTDSNDDRGYVLIPKTYVYIDE